MDTKAGTATLVSAVSDGVFIFAYKSDNTVWVSHPHLPPLTWSQLPAVPPGENINSIGVTFFGREVGGALVSTVFMVSKAGNLYFFNGTEWEMEAGPALSEGDVSPR